MTRIKLSGLGVLAIAGILAAPQLRAQEHSTQEVPFLAPADYRTWSIGINGGVLNQWNIVGLNRDGFDKVRHNIGYSAYIKRQISPSFGLKAQYLGGKVGGIDESAVSATPGNIREFETKTPWSAALSAEFTPANINWQFARSVIKPYIAIGAGALNFETTTTDAEGNAATAEKQTKLYIPVDFGFKFAVANGVNIDLGYQLNWANQDFDGKPGGQYKNDLFSYTHAGVEFALGSPSKPYLGNSNPVASLKKAYIEQYDELVAQKAELEARKAENEKLRSQMERLYGDLADEDSDGVANLYDKCPGTPPNTKVDGAGCPLPEQKAPVIQQITVTEEDRKVVDEAIQNLEFDLGKATIRSTSHASLNKVAALLIEKNFSLKLAGHTDNTGSMQTNMRLSKERAESVKAYLVSKGANPSRIEATGYGPTQPIANNDTAEGRQQNRRVEFTLY